MLEFQGDSLNNFQLPDSVDDGSEGIMIGTKGKIIVPDDLQDLIEEDNVEDDEVFSYTEVYLYDHSGCPLSPILLLIMEFSILI